MAPLAYCDNNFVVSAHDSSDAYKVHLHEIVTTQQVAFVLSPWHWLDMAADADHARGTSMADFCDSLNPLWLFDRRTIQKKEVAAAFYRFANLPAQPPTMVGDISDIIYDLVGTRAYRSCRAFVEYLRRIGPEHPLEVTFRNALEGNRVNSVRYLTGKLPPKLLTHFERLYVSRLLPSTTPAGIEVDAATKRTFLSAFVINDCPAIALETKVTYENWSLKRKLGRNTFLDQQHLMAVPYVDIFVTDDAKLSNVINRATKGAPFRSAKILTKAAFDGTFP